jgi:hypothetical protein
MNSPPNIPTKSELEIAIERMRKGIRDPEAEKEALETLSRRREELRKRIGTVDVAVELIREFRDR